MHAGNGRGTVAADVLSHTHQRGIFRFLPRLFSFYEIAAAQRLICPFSVFFVSFCTSRHRHAVQKVSEETVSAEQRDASQRDASRGAVRSLVQWKGKPDHVFSACDDGTVKARPGLVPLLLLLLLLLMSVSFSFSSSLGVVDGSALIEFASVPSWLRGKRIGFPICRPTSAEI